MPDVIDVQPRKIARYGWRPSLGRYGVPTANVDGVQVLAEVDPRDVISSWVWNQLQLGSCTANTTTNDFRYDHLIDGHDIGPLSRLWVYRGERILEGTLGQGDTGAMGHDAFVVARKGVPKESDWPYGDGVSTFEQEPPAAAVKDQRHYVLRKPVAAVPQSLGAVKAVLSNRQTVSFGFTVYESFESSEVANTGIVPMPGQYEQVLGGHETWLVGYLKSEPNYGLVMNSWGSLQTDGTAWGLNGSGFFLMPWSYLLDPQLVSDLRTIVRAPGK